MYRIMTEDKNRDRIIAVLRHYFQAFTIFSAIGSWKGHLENTLCIECDRCEKTLVLKVADAIRDMNSQDAVLVQELHSTETMVRLVTN